MKMTIAPPVAAMLRDVMSGGLVSVDAGSGVADAARFMLRHHVTALLVLRGGEPVGVLTQHDIAASLADSRQLLARVGALVHGGVVSLPGCTDLVTAHHIMLSRRLRNLMVSDEAGVLIGHVTVTHLRRFGGVELLTEAVQIAEVMDRRPPHLPAELDAAQAAAAMLAAGRHHALLGPPGAERLLSEANLVTALAEGRLGVKVLDALPEHPASIAADASPADAAGVMDERGTNLLVVRDAAGVAIGVLPEYNLLRQDSERYLRRLEQLVAEQAFSLEQSRLLAAVNELPQRLIVKDTESIYRACNKAFADDMGRSIAAIVGRVDADFYSADRARQARADDLKVMRERKPLRIEAEVDYAGKRRWLRRLKQPLIDADGVVQGVLVIFDDVTDEHEASEDLRRRGWALAALNRANGALVQALSEQELLQGVCDAVTLDDEYPLCWIGRAAPDGVVVEVAAVSGTAKAYVDQVRITLDDCVRSTGPFGTAWKQQSTVVENDAQHSASFGPWVELGSQFGIASLLVVPLRGADGVEAALAVYGRQPNWFGPEEVALFEEFAATLQFGIESRRTRQAYEDGKQVKLDHEKQLRAGLEAALGAMAGLLESRDPYTAGHQDHVAALAVAIGREMGLDEDRLRALHLAATVHDLGKIEVPVEILTKPTRLSNAEFAMIKRHPEVAYQLLRRIDFPWPIADIIRQHHEYLDGSGYPQGLRGDQILTEARILTVADIVDAISSDRPYRASLGVDEAVREILHQRGLKLDPVAVDACLAVLGRGDFVPKEL